MKSKKIKVASTMIVALMFAFAGVTNTVEMKAQNNCPFGFQYGGTERILYAINCEIEFVWCWRVDPATGYNDMYIGEIRLIGRCDYNLLKPFSVAVYNLLVDFCSQWVVRNINPWGIEILPCIEGRQTVFRVGKPACVTDKYCWIIFEPDPWGSWIGIEYCAVTPCYEYGIRDICWTELSYCYVGFGEDRYLLQTVISTGMESFYCPATRVVNVPNEGNKTVRCYPVCE